MANKIWIGTSTPGDLNVAANYSPSGVPAAGDNLYIPAGSAAISANVTALNTATLSGDLGTVIFEDGYTGTVATQLAPMQFTCARFEWSGGGQSYIDLEASAIDVLVKKTGSVSEGVPALQLVGSAIDDLVVISGSVGTAFRRGTTATIQDAFVTGSNAILYLAAGTSLTNLTASNGRTFQRCASTLSIASGNGILYTEEIGAIGTLQAMGSGRVYPNSIGTITLLELLSTSCLVDFRTSAAIRAVTTINHERGQLGINRDIVAVGTYDPGYDVDQLWTISP